MPADVTGKGNNSHLFMVEGSPVYAAKIILAGNNNLYIPPRQTWFSDLSDVELVVNAAMDAGEEQAAVSGKVGSVEYSGKNLKHFVLTEAVDVTISPADLEKLQKAIVETGYAYYYKSEDDFVFYSTDCLVDTTANNGREGLIYAVNDIMEPEQIYEDELFGSVCGQYTWSVYRNALEGYDMFGTSRNAYTERMTYLGTRDNPIVVAYYEYSDYATEAEALAAKKALKK